MTLPAKLADVDHNLLGLADTAGKILPALRKRLKAESGKPDTDAGQLEELRKAIRELERAVGMVRWQPSGEKTEITHAGGKLAKSEGEMKAGHKYKSRKKDPKTGKWIYEYDEPDAHQHDMFAEPPPASGGGALPTPTPAPTPAPTPKPVTKVCPRCGGSGHYSYNMVHGTMCYGCQGKGYVLASPNKKGAKVTSLLEYAEAGDVVQVAGIGTARVVEVQTGTFTRKARDPWGGVYDQEFPQMVMLESLIDGKTYRRLRAVPATERIMGGERYRVNKKTNLWRKIAEPDASEKSRPAPRLVLMKAESKKQGAKWVDTGKKLGKNPIMRDQSGREAVRTYEDEGITHRYLDNGDTMFTKKIYRLVGADDDVTTCELCGKTNLKKTAILLDSEGNEYRYGRDCAARAMGWTESEVERTAESEQNKRDMEDRDVRLKAHPLTPEIRDLEGQIASHRNPNLSIREDTGWSQYIKSDEHKALRERMAALMSQRQLAVTQEIRDEANKKMQQRIARDMPQTWRKKLFLQPREAMLQGIADKLDAENARNPGSGAFSAPEGFALRYVRKLRVAGSGMEAQDLKGEWKPVSDLWLDNLADAYRVPGPTAWAAVNHPIHNEAPVGEQTARQQPIANEQKPANVKKVAAKAGDEAEQTMMFSRTRGMLAKAQKGETKAGHKYKARKKDPKTGEWIYEYDEPKSAPAPAAPTLADLSESDIIEGIFYMAQRGVRAGKQLPVESAYKTRIIMTPDAIRRSGNQIEVWAGRSDTGKWVALTRHQLDTWASLMGMPGPTEHAAAVSERELAAKHAEQDQGAIGKQARAFAKKVGPAPKAPKALEAMSEPELRALNAATDKYRDPFYDLDQDVRSHPIVQALETEAGSLGYQALREIERQKRAAKRASQKPEEQMLTTFPAKDGSSFVTLYGDPDKPVIAGPFRDDYEAEVQMHMLAQQHGYRVVRSSGAMVGLFAVGAAGAAQMARNDYAEHEAAEEEARRRLAQQAAPTADEIVIDIEPPSDAENEAWGHEFVGVDYAARELGVSEATVKRMVKEGQLKGGPQYGMKGIVISKKDLGRLAAARGKPAGAVTAKLDTAFEAAGLGNKPRALQDQPPAKPKSGAPSFGDIGAIKRYKTTKKSQAPRGGSGRYTMPGSRDHLHAHRKIYVARRDAGEIDGSQADWLEHLTGGWKREKDDHKIALLQEFRHLEADARGMDEGPDLLKVNERLARLRTKLERLGHTL